jgi:hypothetical protein
VALAADHQVIVDGDAQRPGGLGDLLRHLDVLARGLGIARGVVVHHDAADPFRIENKYNFLFAADRWGMYLGAVRSSFQGSSRFLTLIHRGAP